VRSSRAAFLAGTAAVAATHASPAGAQAASPISIRVASTASDSYAGALYAHDQGFFARAGLDADVQVLASGAAITAAVAAKAIDIGITNAVPLIAAVQRGIQFRYICSGGLVNYDEIGMCVAASSSIATWKDLEGKTVAAPSLNDIAVLAARSLIDQQGGDSSKVHFLEVPFSQMAAFIRRGTVDAGPIAEPALSAAKKEGGIRVIQPALFSAFGPRFMVGGWFAPEDWISANRSTAHRFVDAIYAAAAWANSHPDESSAILTKYSKVDFATLRSMNRSPLGTSLTPDMLQSVLDLSYKYQFSDRHFKAAELIAKV
jgi:NitT/TauT family transport system substrate-binding protein